jgi:hypothetical protein
MASVIRIKRSEVSGNPAVLAAGELAYSGLADNGSNGGDRLYIGTGTETAGNAVNHIVIGGKYFTDMINAATASATASTLVKRNALGNIAVNKVTGDLIGNADTATAWLNSRSLELTGDGTATFTGVDGTSNKSTAFTLATVNSNVGQFGSSTTIPIVTVNAKGLVTAVTTASISTTLNIAGGTGTDGVALGSDTLTFEGGTGVSTTVTNNKVSFAIGQPVATTDNVTFNNLTVNGVFSSNDITATNVTVDGNAIITGNLTVQGTTTTVNSTTVAIGDKNISLAKDATNAAEADGGGITITGPTTPASLTYSAIDDRWNFNKNLNVTTVYGNLVGNADTATKWATARNLELTGDATATLSGVDGSAAVSAALTFATVNSNVGSYGDSVTVPTFTVNAKGLVTAASSTAIPNAAYSTKGLASFDSNQFTITSGAVTILAIDGGTY